MKKLLILFCLILLATKLTAPNRAECYILVSEPVKPYEALIKAVVMVESGGDNYAYNRREGAYGAFQIRAIRLRDYAKRTGKVYTLKDCFDYKISKSIFLYYCKGDYESIAKQWNGSGRKTEIYWNKIQKLL